VQTLPETLTHELLLELMRDERYTNSNHPEHAAFARLVSEGFKRLYGDEPATPDATGRLAPPDA
jgi:hypothetical protein